MDIFSGLYRDRRVMVTGHTGFKGSWLCLWLKELGAIVSGYALPPPTNPNHFDLLSLDIASIKGDIRDRVALNEAFSAFEPEIVFHLAAQALVGPSYINPVETLETNVMGTVNVLETCRHIKSIKAVVIITSDKCYESKHWVWSYREMDEMGGHDPYSASKGCAELITASYRRSFFSDTENKTPFVASARAGNVIGGGDWSEFRLIPDIVRATIENDTIYIRKPASVRPWQHVLEPLSGYLTLGAQLLAGRREFACPWNFGPDNNSYLTVMELIEMARKSWSIISCEIRPVDWLAEVDYLKLDCSKAAAELAWSSVWSIETTLRRTISWYVDYYEKNVVLSHNDLYEYVKDAKARNLAYAL
ncbi:MAG: CDP-glucose 4,6-dehydratase [Nitrospirae bacterium YQR-1]